jgi:hypothetical protein
MFSKVVPRVVGSMGKGNIGRFFNRGLLDRATLKPHSSKHLAKQLEELQSRNRPGEIITLKAGERLLGLNTHFMENMISESPPLYTPKDLQQLSPKEKEHFKQMSDNYLARIAEYVLRKDTPCVKSVTDDSGSPVYYVHDDMTKMENLRPVEEILNFSDNKIHDPGSFKR